MIYMIGGAPRVGKTILAQRLAAQLGIGWISTDILEDQLRFKQVEGMKSKWDASPAAITTAAEWFFPSLERFAWSISSMAREGYVIEGVNFLPGQLVQLSTRYPLRAVFLGCSQMNLDRFDRFPGHSIGYTFLPEETRRQFAQDIPGWSEFIRQEAEKFGCPYVDMSDDFEARLGEAAALLTAGE